MKGLSNFEQRQVSITRFNDSSFTSVLVSHYSNCCILQQVDVHWKIQARLLTKVHHGNLVSIMGYCNEGGHMGLIYEYMANGTIKEHLSEKNPNILSWEKRLQIACDAARALEYLHDDCKPPIIHRDIKTSNILLTENMRAKICDFGLSRLMPSDGRTHVLTAVAGTPGYMDPKYIASSKLNEKSDVYSFGVVLLELITGKPAVLETPENTLLVNWIVPMIERAEIKEIMDLRLNSDFDTNSARKALETAMACVECNLSQRLVMRQVVANLRECLEMEKARVKVWKENEVHNSASGNTVYVSTLGSSVGGPSAR
ncbi:probable LRR receptor-like serine/threonine-protein kinase At4g29180 [Rhododendron vialii]|uniref:probable LRR receptor-like serine/threonine-protein kinase At4g29180 n=1 Tax=Rhododendron vialii TaxID=182163 RepID=UPI00265FA197|nr:probable LRR receptor-like serine/threonine-protein kinase At4g29180 [Rhododendron vialii]